MAAYQTISYCDVTKGPAKIVIPYINDPHSTLFKTFGGFNPGVGIDAHNVYSFESGVVIQVGTNGKHYEVIVQFDVNVSLRYDRMSTVVVSPGQILAKGDQIGLVNNFVVFEYLTLDQGTSVWPVRVHTATYYKQDPTPLLVGDIQLLANDWSKVSVVHDVDSNVNLTPAMLAHADETGE